MRCYLECEKVEIKSLGETLEIRELSSRGQAAVMDALQAKKGNLVVAAITAADCVVEWADETPDDIARNLNIEQLTEVGAAIQRITGIDNDPKASKSDQAAA